ncbi:MAG: hypothetical protein ACODAU_09705 [Myxococcota bacterium]
MAVLLLWSATAAPAAADPAEDREARLERASRLFREGQRAYGEGRLDEAAKKMQEAYRLTRSPDLAYNVARVFERMGEAGLAIRYFQVYVRHELHHGTLSEKERADIEKRIEKLRAMAKRQKEQLYAAPPSDDALTAEARRFFEMGVTMFQRKEYEAAMQAFTAAHRFAALPEVLYNMALTSERLERWRDARDYYREYLRVRPRAPDRPHVERRIAELRGKR